VRLNTTWAVLSGKALVMPMRKEGASHQVQASRFKVQDTIHNSFTAKSPIFNNHNLTLNQDKPPIRIFTTIEPSCQWNIPQLNYNSDVPTIIE
jgi:hypothetical protein